MKDILKILLFGLIGGVAVVVGTYALAIAGLADSTGIINQVFQNFGITYTYDFNTFGEVFRLWSAAAVSPMSGQLLFNSPLSLQAVTPIVLLVVVCFVMGYLFEIQNSITVSFLVILWSLVIGIGVAMIVPYTLPAIGLSPTDFAFVRGLADDLILFTILAPPNMIVGTILTIGLGVFGAVFGGVIRQFTSSKPSKKGKKKGRLTRSKSVKKKKK